MILYNKSIDISQPFSFIHFSRYLEELMDKILFNDHTDIIILCIGTDRSTGDCLGPLVGHKLKDMKLKNVHVLGYLDKPVHAKNLKSYLHKLSCFQKPFVIAIDACLGKSERIGYINIKEGPLQPGAGVNKNLPSVGDISITGIVNVSGFMEIMVLQNTRLSLVMNMANIISSGLKYSLRKAFKEENLPSHKPISIVSKFENY